MRLLFLVNGQDSSAAGVRARAFAEHLPGDWKIEFQYRPLRKWKGILPFVRAALRFHPDVVYVMDTAYTGVLAGTAAKKLLRCRLVTDTGDAAYALAKSAGGYSQRQLKLIQSIEQMAMKHSDCIVVRGSYHRTLLEQEGVRKCVFIPDGVSLEGQQPIDSTALRADWNFSERLVLGMLGSMSWSPKYEMCYGWDVIEALGLLKDKPVGALLIGDGDGRTRLEARAAQLGVEDRVVFTGTLPYQELARVLSAMDICVSTQSNDVVGMVRTTGKLPLYLALNRYVIATDVGEARQVLPGVGSLLPYEGVRDDAHPARLAAEICKLIECPTLMQKANQGREIVAQHFDYRILAGRVRALCEELTARRG